MLFLEPQLVRTETYVQRPLSDINQNRIASMNFRKNLKYEISQLSTRWKTLCSMVTGSRFCNVYTNAPTNWPHMRSSGQWLAITDDHHRFGKICCHVWVHIVVTLKMEAAFSSGTFLTNRDTRCTQKTNRLHFSNIREDLMYSLCMQAHLTTRTPHLTEHYHPLQWQIGHKLEPNSTIVRTDRPKINQSNSVHIFTNGNTHPHQQAYYYQTTLTLPPQIFTKKALRFWFADLTFYQFIICPVRAIRLANIFS